MTKAEEQTIRNIIARLRKPNCGCANRIGLEPIVKAANDVNVEVVSRIYLDTWVIGALECLLPGEQRNPELARRLSQP